MGGVLALLMMTGCGDRPEADPVTTLPDGTMALSHADLITDSVRGDLVLSTERIGDPRFMTLVGTRLWISDRSGDPYLHVIDLVQDSLVESRGRSGEGPGDYGEVPQLTTRPGDTTAIWAYDASLRRLTREPADPQVARRIVQMFGDTVHGVYSMQWQNAGSLAGIGDIDTNRIILADSTGALASLVPNRLLGPDSVSIEARRAISSGYSMCVQPGGGGIAVLYLAAGQVDLYHRSGQHIAQAEVPFSSDGQWVINRRGELWFRVDWNYYVGCTGTDQFVYGLFTGQRIDGPAGPLARRAMHVHVFDWEGNRRAIWALDHPASTIAVSGDSMLFATGQDGTGLYRYTLPAIP
jgi:hypothetical protein